MFLPGILSLAAFVLLPGSVSAQGATGPPSGPGTTMVPRVRVPPDWYSGDTHDHVQLCCANATTCLGQYAKGVLDTCDIDASMAAEGLDVSSVLVWEPGANNPTAPFTKYVCALTGVPETSCPHGAPLRGLIQYGVEVSGLGAARWGHLVGLGIGGYQGRIATAPAGAGTCAAAAPLSVPCPGPDGTGSYLGPICDRFAACGGARGAAHQAWPLGIYDPAGYPVAWLTGKDYRCLDPEARLAFPDVGCLLDCELKTLVLPPFAAIQVALGQVDFLEADHLSKNFGYRPGQTCNESPCLTSPAPWYGAYYKLLDAGLRVGIGAGSDRSCGPATGTLGTPRTYVHVPGGLSYAGWVAGLVGGRATLSMGKDLFLDLCVNGLGIGSDVALLTPGNQAGVVATLETSMPLSDTIEIVQDGAVVATLPFVAKAGETVRLALPSLPFAESGWIAARLASQNAHTAATFVTVDGSPIADCLAAEYWMAWCDVLAARIQGAPGQLFGCVETDTLVLADVARARRIFEALRDLDDGSGALQRVQRMAPSLAGERGPLSVGVPEAVRAGRPFELTCTNAPRGGEGWLLLSHGGSGVSRGPRPLLDPGATLVQARPVRAGLDGFASVTVEQPSHLPAGTTLSARFVWLSPRPCRAPGGQVGPSASDTARFAILP